MTKDMVASSMTKDMVASSTTKDTVGLVRLKTW